jgi:endonuclease YncB( thermonuclease family)
MVETVARLAVASSAFSGRIVVAAMALAVGVLAPADPLIAAPAAASGGGCPAAGSETAVVAAVADARTLRLADGTLVRLAGIDVPAAFAASAAVTLGQLVPAGLDVTLQFTSSAADRYGRRHAYVFLAAGGLLQTALAGKGAARARWLPGEADCFAALIAAEEPARRARQGLWSASDAILAADDPSLVRRSGLYEVVGGRLASVGHGSTMTFLDFGRNHRRDFTVMVPAPVAEALTRALGPVDALTGKRLLVRGVVEDNRGAAIRLNDAAEIELSDDPPKP